MPLIEAEECICLIPARYQSSRFPGKPLVSILGTPMVVRVAQTAMKVFDQVAVATDDERIISACKNWGVTAIETAGYHATGTDRVAEAARQFRSKRIINVQGDEPTLSPTALRHFWMEAGTKATDVANAYAELGDTADPADPSIPKVVADQSGIMKYISRAAIPYFGKTSATPKYWRQLGIYSFTAEALEKYASFGGRGRLEAIEDIEILRFLELSTPVSMIDSPAPGPAVDLPKHVSEAEAYLRGNGDGART